MIGRMRKTLVLVAVAASVAACGSDGEDDGAMDGAEAAATPDAATRPTPQRLPGTPEGGLEEWVAEIRTGLSALPELVPESLAAAQQRTVQLYVGRQEWLERYYGTAGMLVADTSATLPRAVMDAEARFHELLQLVTEGAPTREAVRSAVGAVDAEFERVLKAARAESPPPIPAAGARGAG